MQACWSRHERIMKKYILTIRGTIFLSVPLTKQPNSQMLPVLLTHHLILECFWSNDTWPF